MPREQEESITQGVQRLRVGERALEADGPVGGGDEYEDGDEGECDAQDDDTGNVSRLRTASMGDRAGKSRACASAGRRQRRWWVGVARPKTTGRQRVARTSAVQEGALQVVQGEFGKEDFFWLSAKERLTMRFHFTMDRAVYVEIKGSIANSHTIHPQTVADTGGAGGVQLPSGSSGTPESVGDGDAGGDGNDEDDNSTRGCSQTTGGLGGFGKRKNVRQQTFEALTECMEKHGTLMASTLESASKRQCSIQIRQCSIQIRQCEALEAEVEVQKKPYVASNEVSKMMCHGLMEIAKAIPDR
ncbi:hypothetical protein CBR_g16982 [Chara braunii]|uniref:Uncharacterized protein n=1 Tax=Chara braunii TaxID=69332 RepID=A0A388KUC4_CHABU|nr:hypothetical protein CBR_g16982 [Chara braunii]|eukprot:GBG73639.1 hypothetical protein CBR_g16982 [Chara braunii]